jgi:hypothetical protein
MVRRRLDKRSTVSARKCDQRKRRALNHDGGILREQAARCVSLFLDVPANILHSVIDEVHIDPAYSSAAPSRDQRPTPPGWS